MIDVNGPAFKRHGISLRAGALGLIMSALPFPCLQGAPGDVDPQFSSSSDDYVQSVTLQADRRVLIGGRFNLVQNVARRGSARLSASSGALDTGFDPNLTLGAEVLAQSALDDGTILVMGRFTTARGVARNYIARFNTNGTLVNSFNPNLNDAAVTALIQADGKLLIGGPFSSVGGVTRRQLARLNTDGSLDASLNLPANGTVFTIAAQPDGKAVLGGSFTTLAGVGRNHVARLNPDGTLDANFNPNVNGGVLSAVVQADGRILIGGTFTSVGGVPRNSVARLHPDGTVDPSFNPDPRGDGVSVCSIVLQCDGKIIFSGNRFTTVRTVSRTQIARVDQSGNLDETFDPRVSDPGIVFGTPSVFTTLQADGKVLIVGLFTVVNGVQRRWVARLQNDPVSESLKATAKTRVEWLRGGSLPETQQVSLAVSTNEGATWLPLGPASRIPGGWEVTGVDLPMNGQLRGRARVQGGEFNGSSSLLETITPFALPSPSISIYDGPTTAAPKLTSGQPTAVDFGQTRQGTPVLRSLTIESAGTVALSVTGFRLPAGYRVFNLPVLPRAIEPGQTLTLPIQLIATAGGKFEGSIVVTSNSEQDGTFEVPITGLVTTPEIAVHEGTDASGPEILAGQATAVDFGRNVQGTPGVRNFAIVNIGTAPLLVRQITIPTGFEMNSSTLPATVAVGGSLAVQVSLTTSVVGTHEGRVQIESDDTDESLFAFPIAGEVFIPPPVASFSSDTAVLNRQTGLREQTIQLVNDTTALVPAFRILIRGLPNGVKVFNATGILPDGTVVVLVREPMKPHSTKVIVLEYFSATRQPTALSPEITVEVELAPPPNTVADGTGTITVERILVLGDGSALLEFASVIGRSYQIQYSSDGILWKDSQTRVSAPGNRTQWIDRGPPRTDKPPSEDPARFYRVKEVSP